MALSMSAWTLRLRWDAAKAAPYALSVDEWRELAGQEPSDNEDEGVLHAVPSTVSMMTLEDAAKKANEPPPAPPQFGPDGTPMPPPKPGEQPKPGEPKPGENQPKPGEKPLDDKPEKPNADQPPKKAFHAKGVADAAKQQEPELTRALVRAWKDGKRRVDMKALVKACGRKNVAAAIEALNLDATGKLVRDAYFARAVRAFMRGAVLGSEPLRRRGVHVRELDKKVEKSGFVLQLDAVNPLAVEWARDHAGDLVQAPDDVRRW